MIGVCERCNAEGDLVAFRTSCEAKWLLCSSCISHVQDKVEAALTELERLQDDSFYFVIAVEPTGH